MDDLLRECRLLSAKMVIEDYDVKPEDAAGSDPEVVQAAIVFARIFHAISKDDNVAELLTDAFLSYTKYVYTRGVKHGDHV